MTFNWSSKKNFKHIGNFPRIASTHYRLGIWEIFCDNRRYEKLKWWIRACPTVMSRNERRISPRSKARVFVLYFVAAERKSAPPLSCLPQRLIPSSKARSCAVINDYKVFRTDDYQSAPDAPAVPLHNFRDFDVHVGSCFLPHCASSYNRPWRLYRVLRKGVWKFKRA